MRQWIRAVLDRFDRWLTPVAAASRFLAGIYYAVLNPRFGRELRATAAGRAAYEASTREAPIALLRRNIHRLEKGLTMKPRSPVFAEGYILETVLAYRRLLDSNRGDPNTLRWAHDVLADYFTAVDETPVTMNAKKTFSDGFGNKSRDEINSNRWSPRRRGDGVASGVSYEQFLLLCRQRRSTRWFLKNSVPSELIDKALEAALQAPSACNRQPFFFRVFLNPNETAEIASIAMGTAGYSQQIPALVVVIGDLSCFEHERDRHIPYIDGSLAAMQLMLALETLGLASCPINWPDIEHLERRMAKRLNLAPFHRPLMMLAIGHPDPDGGVAYSVKKTPAQIKRQNYDNVR